MTKVEELREEIVNMAQGVPFSEISTFLRLLNNYAIAAEAVGVEREVERERQNARTPKEKP